MRRSATGLCVAALTLTGCTGDADRGSSRFAAPYPPEIIALREAFQTTLDSLWQAAQETDEVFPGATAAFILADGSVHAFATGWSDVEAAIEMEPDMRMPSGSIGKTYVSALALNLVHEGLLDLDDPISTWLGDEPWFDRLPNAHVITLRMLLNHSGGLIDHAFDSEDFLADVAALVEAGDPDALLEPRETVRYALDQEPLFPAGRGFNYTDTGYIVVGLILEKVSASDYYVELRRRLLEPLGLEMTHTQDRRDSPRLSQGYGIASAQIFGTPEKVVGDDGRMVFHPGFEWTGGGLYNNPQALVTWAKALYEGLAFPGDYLDDLLGSAAEEGHPDPSNVYSLGVSVRQTPLGTTYGHTGFFPGYNSAMIYFPDQRVAVALQINTDRSRMGAHAMTLAGVLLAQLAIETEPAES